MNTKRYLLIGIVIGVIFTVITLAISTTIPSKHYKVGEIVKKISCAGDYWFKVINEDNKYETIQVTPYQFHHHQIHDLFGYYS